MVKPAEVKNISILGVKVRNYSLKLTWKKGKTGFGGFYMLKKRLEVTLLKIIFGLSLAIPCISWTVPIGSCSII